ncbi:hypothetical protein BSLG_004294 [Batrachochytrium salamandrivorans]|nr:hypothetical protein BSLG_004294 [Batrachochytrium salamandrivorans]
MHTYIPSLFKGERYAKIIGKNVVHQPNFQQGSAYAGLLRDCPQGQRLSDIINSTHENIKYLPNIKIPDNVVAVPELLNSVEDATLLVFVHSSPVCKGVCDQLKDKIAKGTRAILKPDQGCLDSGGLLAGTLSRISSETP